MSVSHAVVPRAAGARSAPREDAPEAVLESACAVLQDEVDAHIHRTMESWYSAADRAGGQARDVVAAGGKDALERGVTAFAQQVVPPVGERMLPEIRAIGILHVSADVREHVEKLMPHLPVAQAVAEGAKQYLASTGHRFQGVSLPEVVKGRLADGRCDLPSLLRGFEELRAAGQWPSAIVQAVVDIGKVLRKEVHLHASAGPHRDDNDDARRLVRGPASAAPPALTGADGVQGPPESVPARPAIRSKKRRRD